VAESADALDLGSSGQPWGFKSPLSHQARGLGKGQMRVQLEDVSSVKKRLRVEVPNELVVSRMEAAYRELAKTARVKGFRPNRVPRPILERLYRSQVEGQVATELVEATYPEALGEAKLEPLSRPIIEDYDLKQGEDFRFSALVEVRPEFEIEGYTGLELEREDAEITEEMVDAQLEMLRDEHAQMEDVDEPLAEGLWANADFVASSEGKPVKPLSTKGELIRLGGGEEQSELERAILGMRAGEEREVTLHLPENYHLPSLRDKDVTFKVKVHAVKRKVLPPLDEELAKELKFESVAKIREQVRRELAARAEATSRRKLRDDLVTKLVELADFEVPESMIERELDHMVESFKQRLGPRRVDPEQVNLPRVRENFRKGAERRARAELILGRIAEKEAIEVSEDDLEKGINELAADMNEEPQRIREFHERAGLMESLRRHLREEKTMDFLVGHAKLKEQGAQPGASPPK
jgi:trigger factor